MAFTGFFFLQDRGILFQGLIHPGKKKIMFYKKIGKSINRLEVGTLTLLGKGQYNFVPPTSKCHRHGAMVTAQDAKRSKKQKHKNNTQTSQPQPGKGCKHQFHTRC